MAVSRNTASSARAAGFPAGRNALHQPHVLAHVLLAEESTLGVAATPSDRDHPLMIEISDGADSFHAEAQMHSSDADVIGRRLINIIDSFADRGYKGAPLSDAQSMPKGAR